MLPKIIRTGIHRYEGTGVRKTEMATQYRKAYVPVTLDVDKEGAILPRLIWWDNGVIFQIDQILYKCRATSKKVGGRRHPLHSSDSRKGVIFFTKETSGSSKQRRTTAHDFIPAPT